MKKDKPATISMGMVAPQQITKPATQIQGKVVNHKQEPVPFATITSSDGNATVADSLGQFKIRLVDKASLSISHIGYQQQNFTIDSLQTNNISNLKLENGKVVIETKIEMKQQEVITDEVVVVCYGAVKKLTGSVGSISIITSKTIFTKEKTIVPINTLPQIKIFPNPIKPGQDFQITFQLKKTGYYLLMITDAAGKSNC